MFFVNNIREHCLLATSRQVNSVTEIKALYELAASRKAAIYVNERSLEDISVL